MSTKSGASVDERDNVTQGLHELADVHGVATEYHDFQGELRQVPTATVVAVLEALGVSASTPEAVRASLADAEVAPWREMVPTVQVVRVGADATFPVHVPHGTRVEVWIELESDGEPRPLGQRDVYVDPRLIDGQLIGRATFALPTDLPLGWHTVHARCATREAVGTVVVVPNALTTAPPTGSTKSWGLMAQLYSVRSKASWGIGDFADLAELTSFAGRELGAGFVLVNPLHAGEPVPPLTASPYLPTTRRFINPIYIRPEDIRETGYVESADRALIEWQAEVVQRMNNSLDLIDRDAVWSAKKAALEIVFGVPRSAARQALFDDFRAEQGEGLTRFATWCALVEHFDCAATGLPAELSDPRSAAVRSIAAELAESIEFYEWLQWIADEQLAAVQQAAKTAGMPIGLMTDLAVGVHPFGADTWAAGDVLATSMQAGAPADMYNQQGQNWSQPPLSPTGLRAHAYRPFANMVRSALRHAGAVRVDHILGLFRLWWIPAGARADEGTYVRYDHEALVGILCLEAERAGAVVIGEDLGVVEPWVRANLAERGILGTSVLWFEFDEAGGVLPPERWRRLCLATVTTHDLPPTAGYLAGEHVDLRERLGLLAEPADVVRKADHREQRRLLDQVAARGLLPADASERQKVEALYRYVRIAPSQLTGVALTDAVGERRAQNQPGTDHEYPNWRLPLCDGSQTPVLIEDLPTNARLRSLVEAVAARPIHQESVRQEPSRQEPSRQEPSRQEPSR